MHGQDDPGVSQVERRTHGSDQRPARDLSVRLRGFDVNEVAERLCMEPAFLTDGRNALTVHDDGYVRVMVGVVAAGREVGARRNDGYVTLTLVEGRGTLRRADDALELPPGSTAIVAPGAPWSLDAVEPSVLVAYFWDVGDDGVLDTGLDVPAMAPQAGPPAA